MAEFSKALVLTTPQEKSQRVKDAQYLMQGHSVFGDGLACFKDGTRDGAFGTVTAQAAARTKFWLGYAPSSCTPTFGQPLYNLLTGKTTMTPAQKKARASRLALATPGSYAFACAMTQIGITEDPAGSNRQKYGLWYGMNGVPWCAIFESYCFAHDEKPYKRYKYASVEAIYYDALAGRNGLRQVWTPRQGDIVLYSINGEEFAHTEFYDQKINATSFYAVGGNTSAGNMSNGGIVQHQARQTSIVKAYARVG